MKFWKPSTSEQLVADMLSFYDAMLSIVVFIFVSHVVKVGISHAVQMQLNYVCLGLDALFRPRILFLVSRLVQVMVKFRFQDHRIKVKHQQQKA